MEFRQNILNSLGGNFKGRLKRESVAIAEIRQCVLPEELIVVWVVFMKECLLLLISGD
jgi:hypothetical protein